MEQRPERLEFTEEEDANLLRRQKAEESDIPAWKQIPAAVTVDRWVSSIEDWLNIVGVTLIVVMMSLTVAGIVGRYFFNWPIPGEVDITEILMAGIVFLGLAFTLRTGGHVRIELFVGMLRRRAYHLTEFSTLLLTLFLFAVTFVSSLRFTINSWAVGDVTPEILLPTWPAKLCITIGSFLICLRLIILLIQHLSQVIAGIERKNL